MAENLEELLYEYNVPFRTKGKNTSRNFVNVSCADSGGDCEYDDNYTMGISRSMTHTYCWWCGKSFPIFNTKERDGVLSTLGISKADWLETKSYVNPEDIIETEVTVTEVTKKDVIVPGEGISEPHRLYLKERGLDPDWLIKEYNIQGTTYMPKGQDAFAYRVWFPIKHKDKIISYLGRSYLPNPMNKYMCCDPKDEILFHKHFLFNQDRVTGRKGILVEGPTDVLNLVQSSGNFNIVATYGTRYTNEQLQQLRRLFDEVTVMYDNETAAQSKALEIVSYLQSYGIIARSVCLKAGNDPGGLEKSLAKKIVDYYIG